MFRKTAITLALGFTFLVNAQENPEKQKIKLVIDTFFEGLHTGDSTLMGKTLYKDVKIKTTATNSQGKKILITDSKEKLLTGIANKNPEVSYFEKILSYDIKIDGNLASVWTPYEFYANKKFSHCGANSFQLFDNNGTWQIIYLVDMRRREGCSPSEK